MTYLLNFLLDFHCIPRKSLKNENISTLKHHKHEKIFHESSFQCPCMYIQSLHGSPIYSKFGISLHIPRKKYT